MRGRNVEWQAAIRLLDSQREGLTILLVEGALGTGKSRFLQEVAKAAGERGFTFVPQADRAFPVSAKWWRDSSAFSDGIHALLTSDPLVGDYMLAADDIHAAHLDLVRELCCIIRYRQSSSLILALTRRDSLSPVPEFERWLASNTDRVVRIRLGSLDHAMTAEVASDVLGVPPGANLMTLLADTGGNPLLLTELLNGLREENRLAYISGTAMLISPELPQRVERLVAGLVREFSPPTQKVLRLAATLGVSFDVSELAELQSEPVGNLLPAIDELLASGVFAPSGQQMSFQYPLVRHALVSTMPRPLVVALQKQSKAMVSAVVVRGFSALTESERTIAELAAEGLTNGQIARRVNRSSHTVNFHLRQVFRKLGIRSRVELARLS